MFMCFRFQTSVINLDLTWKQSFLILVDSKTLWTMLPVPVRFDTLKRPRTFTLPHQEQTSEHHNFYSTTVKHSF
jgi:hypothetical protein